MLRISELYIYPIKSLAGIKVDQALITDRGLEYDRRWMLIDANNRFISQREVAMLAQLNVSISTSFLTVEHMLNHTSINIPLITVKQQLIAVTIWDDTCIAQLVSDEIDNWFTNILGINCRLVYMPDNTKRLTDPQYTNEDSITSFSDAYPFMIIGQSSLNDLNKRLSNAVSMNRFRPNIIFTGGEPYQEDVMNSITINNVNFNGVKLCARCNIISIDQSDASNSKEPAKTLASYRTKNNKIYFGQNLIHSGPGNIAVGDELLVSTVHYEERFIIA
ncbi:MOSC N-terminal beta barrel domain-containing protein [Mucilaginibacter sp.]|uniref:MOSC domain-containing protein n=1 Tax=Mucilaginibacter sp. TaxID=1882438 RepID=UPI00260500AB|nr:MOSC N-terminal beta barrel domain-containing protein [Mucilaginibacter sp.]MDB4927212.1 hypothetical protein [Mucilaginibacter sp.]